MFLLFIILITAIPLNYIMHILITLFQCLGNHPVRHPVNIPPNLITIQNFTHPRRTNPKPVPYLTIRNTLHRHPGNRRLPHLLSHRPPLTTLPHKKTTKYTNAG